METCLLILLYIISFFQASGDRQTESSNLDCLYDSFETVICTWIPVKNAMKGQCQLTASVDYGKPPKTCQMNGTSIRSCKLILEDYSLAIIDPLFLVVSCNIGKKWTEVHSQTIEPFKNIQLQPPCNLQLENASKPSYNLTWTLCVVSHYLKEKLEYEIRYRANSSGETETILPIAQDQKWVIIENLSPGTVFEAAIRVKIKQISYYNSIWSRWSTPPLRWRTDPEASPQTTFLPVIVAIAGSFIISIFVIFLIVSPASKCFRKMLKINLPDPAEFFPSLTDIHGGDIQKWLSSPASITSFNITAEAPNVSILEIMQNSSKESCLLPPKEYFTNIENTAETSGESSSSCFMNRGYFFFHHLDSLEIDSCKVYFTYDAVTRSEDSDFYFHKELHEASHNFPSSTNIMTNQENGAFIQDYSRDIFPSGGNFPIASTIEQNENMEDRIPLVLSSNSPEQYSIDDSSKPQSSSHNTGGIELLRNEDLSNNVMRNNRFMFSNQDQSNDFCRAASSSQIPSSSEGTYLSLRDFQRHYSHHSV
ncbi:interleukin-2 receptor subunit beta [Protobothrops mucrosquamatus]|uniref:interleukin-2 receptor subunit beta n=1 Tax=Protobothrops mucrosquamatus TaxID=103944 RepID=UPI0007757C51|nr:interleukin-2 receptor subunit beta [Protobothrops mucrosquamatus]